MGKVFIPEEELIKVRLAPRKERVQKLREFKKKLSYQKEGLAKLQIRVLAAIDENPDTSFKRLYQIVESEGVKYGITEEQKEVAKSILQAYIEKHEQIRKIRKQYPDDTGLYQALFGRAPAGPIKVIEGPMTLYFRCENIQDFTRIATKAHLWGCNFTQQDIDKSKRTAGVFTFESWVPGLNGTILAEKSMKLDLGVRISTLLHEKQHAADYLFRKIVRHTIYKRLLRHKRILRKSSLKYYLRFLRQSGEEFAGSEIMAFSRSGEHPALILYYLTQSENEGGLYDYLDKKKRHLNNFARYFGEQPALVEEVVKEIWEIEYRRLLESGLNAFLDLTKAGYSKEEVIAILVHEPLARWPKVAKRLVKIKS